MSHVVKLGDRPRLDKLIGPVKVQLDAYIAGQIDEIASGLYAIRKHHEADAGRETDPSDRRPRRRGRKRAFPWDYIYEPDARTVLDGLLTRYIEIDHLPGGQREHGLGAERARMVAMKAASDNAGTIIDELQLIYNKTRQAAITKELSEIVGRRGARSERRIRSRR